MVLAPTFGQGTVMISVGCLKAKVFKFTGFRIGPTWAVGTFEEGFANGTRTDRMLPVKVDSPPVNKSISSPDSGYPQGVVFEG